MASGKNRRDRAKYIVANEAAKLSEIRRSHNEHKEQVQQIEQVQRPDRSIPAVAVPESQEDQKMSTVTTEVTRPSTARPLSICSECGKNKLSYNNGTGTCGNCRKHSSQKTNGHNGAHPRRELQASPKRKAAPAKPNGNGAVHHDSVVHSNENGNGAHVESRVELLLAQIPREDKTRLLLAYLAGTI